MLVKVAELCYRFRDYFDGMSSLLQEKGDECLRKEYKAQQRYIKHLQNEEILARQKADEIYNQLDGWV